MLREASCEDDEEVRWARERGTLRYGLRLHSFVLLAGVLRLAIWQRPEREAKCGFEAFGFSVLSCCKDSFELERVPLGARECCIFSTPR